jgi:hypothetical protein
MTRKAILLALLLALLLTTATQAMSSANYRLDWLLPLTSGGGGEGASEHYVANYSVGQTAVDQSASANYQAHLGFWQEFLRYLRLPLVQK